MKYLNPKEEIKAELLEEIPNLADDDVTNALPAVLSRQECRQLIDFYTWARADEKRNHLVIRMLYATGVRIGELETLKYCDIDYENKVVFVRLGKGSKDRYTCMDPETATKLKEFQGTSAPADSIFSLSDRQLRRIVEKAGKETGIADKYEAMGRVFSPHCLRHSFSSHLYENGVRLFSLKKMLGHAFLETTEIYVDAAVNFEILEYQRCHPFRPPLQAENKEEANLSQQLP